jgi:predicted MPP superfamily phosphohydrolase
MNLLILHLSDIHFTAKNDPIFKRVEPLVASLRPHLPHAACIVIVVSGDIAQTGAAAEYKLATRFLSDVRSRLQGEAKIPIHTILAPGNHDCDFRGDQAARQLVVDAMLKHSGPLPGSYLKTATKVQSDFFAFRKSEESKATLVSPDDRLWTDLVPEKRTP